MAQDGSGFDPSIADAVVAEITEAGGTAAACYENLEDAAAGERIVEFAVARFGRLDALVHNAGLVVFASLEETGPAVWDPMVAIGVSAPFHLARAAVPHMRKQNYGRIVLTTSGRAMRVEHCVPGLIAYSAAKMAQVGLMVGLAAELHDTDIHVNAISPVAATRVLRRRAPELAPELVAPGVAFLASLRFMDTTHARTPAAWAADQRDLKALRKATNALARHWGLGDYGEKRAAD